MLKIVVGVGQLLNCPAFCILLDLVGVGDWKVPPVFPLLIPLKGSYRPWGPTVNFGSIGED